MSLCRALGVVASQQQPPVVTSCEIQEHKAIKGYLLSGKLGPQTCRSSPLGDSGALEHRGGAFGWSERGSSQVAPAEEKRKEKEDIWCPLALTRPGVRTWKMVPVGKGGEGPRGL